MSLAAEGVFAAPLSPSDVLILVNANSPCSRSVADLYRRKYPGIAPEQVLYLGGVAAYPAGLPDCASSSATAATEIISRAEYETLIAQPVRDYLINAGRVNTTYCIITTAGMPYRIRDTVYANVVLPAASNPNETVTYLTYVDAASVESELAVLWQIDPALPVSSTSCPTCPGLPTRNRVVNPYNGYRSGIKDWAAVREGQGILARRETFKWVLPRYVSKGPLIEGQTATGGSATGRRMSPADIYLVARLDGPRAVGEYPIFAVHDMVNRAAMVSDPTSLTFAGYNPASTDLIVDDSQNCCPAFQCTPSYNLRTSAIPGGGEYAIDFAQYPIPPGGEDGLGTGGTPSACHHDRTMQWLTGAIPGETMLIQAMNIGLGSGGNCFWDGTNTIMSRTVTDSILGPGRGIIGLLTYGCNGSDGRPQTYLRTSGPGGGALFNCAPGAVFSSIESYNAVTMFTSYSTGQGKIADFIQIGGTAAVGYAFEPVVSALVQGDYLMRNLTRDDNQDGVADLSFVEAAYTSIPFLSWATVVVGDPLMRIQIGPGGLVSTVRNPGDADGDGYVGYGDLFAVMEAFNTMLGDPLYSPAADIDRDTYVGYGDLFEVMQYFGMMY